MIVRLATHADRLPKSSQRRSCLLAEPKDTAKSLDEAISVQPLVNSRGAGLAYDFFRFLRRPLMTASLDEAGKSAWCRERGVYPQELEQWRESATQALAEPEEIRASPRETKADRRRIKELERELRRKDKALAETAALLVLSKKLEAIFQQDKDEDE